MVDRPNPDSHQALAPLGAPPSAVPRREMADAYGPLDGRLANSGQESSPISLAFVWYVVRRRWPLALPLGLILAVAAMAVVWVLFEPTYRAEQLLQIHRERPVVVQQLAQEESELYVETQIELLRSALVLGRVLADSEIAAMPEIRREEDPRKWLASRIQVEPVGKSELFSVAFEGPNRVHCQQIVDAVVETYFAMSNSESDRETQQLLDVLDKEKTRQIAEVERLQQDVQALAKDAAGGSSVNLDSMGRTVLDMNPALNLLQQRLVDTQVEVQIRKAEIKVHAESPGTVSAGVNVTDIDTHPQIVALREAIDVDRTGLAALRKDTEPHRQREKRIAAGEAALVEARAELETHLSKYHAEGAVMSRADELANLNRELRQFEEREKHLQARFEQERQQMESRTGNSFQLEFRQNELARAKEVAQRIEDRIFWLRVELVPSQRPNRVVLLQPAAVADKFPIEAIPYKKLAMVGLLAFCLPLGLMGAWERVSQRIYQPQQLAQESLVPLLGEVAVMPARPLLPRPGHRRRYEQERAIFEESVESLRTSLAVSDRLQGLQIMVVASAVSGEGKTSLASQLAVSWARGGDGPVLVIDADLRRPGLHDVFGVERSPGLAEVLRGECQVDAAIVDWGNDVHILAAGHLKRNPHRLFSGSNFASLLQEVRRTYRRIVIDVPPILSAGETLHLAKAADGVLLCVMKDHSRSGQVKLAYERLAMAGACTVGAVLSGTSTHDYAYRYGEYFS
jgi:succinoglycan biosynthesis transport protein ExoP